MMRCRFEDPRLIFDSDSAPATDAFARHCAQAVRESLTIGLIGELGSGKTAFVRSFCAGLGVDENTVNSPTFVLMQNYEGAQCSVSHFDTYRLADVDEFLAIGAEEWLADPQRVCLIEWADRVADVLPEDRLTITVTHTGRDARRFELTASGVVSGRFLSTLRESLPR